MIDDVSEELDNLYTIYNSIGEMVEPTIIDGVNVNGCQYYRTKYKNNDDHIVNCCTQDFNHCTFKYNCYYKQLKRKEKQLEKYALCIIKVSDITNDLLFSLCNNCAWYHTDGCNPEDFTCGVLLQIKQLINGVENALDSN